MTRGILSDTAMPSSL